MTEFEKYNQIIMAKKARIRELSIYLENGLYTFDKNFKSVFNTAKTTHPMINNLKNTKKGIQFSLKIEEPQLKYFNGNILRFCINGDIKIFSDDKVLIICANKESYQRKIENYTHFSSFFRIPALIKQDAENNILTEEFISFLNNTDNDEAFIFQAIYNDYCSYFNHLILNSKIDYLSLNSLLETSSNAKYINQFEKITENIVPELLSINLPFINLHGDLWSDNILLSYESKRKTLWYIDWETAGKYVFFYDFFKFIWNELDVHNNYSYCEKYLAGNFDEKLSRLFAIFNLKFHPKFRQSYFCLFFLNYILKDTDNIAFKHKYEEIIAFENKVFPLISLGTSKPI